MKERQIEQFLSGGDLRSIANVNELVRHINDPLSFDALFRYMFIEDRKIVMRAADAVEKISEANPGFLTKHKKDILTLLFNAQDKELKWHLALIVSRLKLTTTELGKVWQQLTEWLVDKKQSRIVRVNSLQGLYNLMMQNLDLKEDLLQTIAQVQREEIPSLNARIRNLKL